MTRFWTAGIKVGSREVTPRLLSDWIVTLHGPGTPGCRSRVVDVRGAGPAAQAVPQALATLSWRALDGRLELLLGCARCPGVDNAHNVTVLDYRERPGSWATH
jgi:hypothetical protein